MKTGPKEIARECLAVRIRVLDRAITAIYNRHLRPHGIRLTQLNIMVAVGSVGRARPEELCRALAMEKSSLSRTANRLKDKGLLAMEPGDDQRGHFLALTSEGEDLLLRVGPDWQQAQEETRALLGPKGEKFLHRAVGRLEFPR